MYVYEFSARNYILARDCSRGILIFNRCPVFSVDEEMPPFDSQFEMTSYYMKKTWI